MSASAGALAEHDDLERLQHDPQIEDQIAVLDVVQVVLELLQRLAFGRAVWLRTVVAPRLKPKR